MYGSLPTVPPSLLAYSSSAIFYLFRSAHVIDFRSEGVYL
jgi:hypothetical protein